MDGLIALGYALEFVEGEAGAGEEGHGSYRCTSEGAWLVAGG